MRAVVAFLIVAVLSISSRADEPSAGDDEYDLALLKSNSVKSDAEGLLAFFRNRTLDETKTKRIAELIQQMGSARFQVRDKATKELLALNVLAIKHLELATKDPDQEIAERARRLIEQIKNGPGTSLPIAAARQLRKYQNDETVAVLLAYAPFADDEIVEEELLGTLLKLGLKDGKGDARFVDAIKDTAARRRSAAGYILGRSKSEDQRALARKLLTDIEPWTRLRTAEGLIAGADNAAVTALIALVHPAAEEVSWRAEELLRRIAGEKSPDPSADEKPETRKAYQQKWTEWWAKNEKEIDLAKLPSEPPALGLYLGIEYNTNSVWEATRDGKRRWTIKAEGPMDAQVLPGNRILIAEQTAKRVTERDLQGNILWEFPTDGEAQNCHRLPNGNTFIATRNDVMEVRPNKTLVFKHRLSEQYMHGVRRMPNGNFVGLTSLGVIHEMTPAGKLVRSVTMKHEGTWGDVYSLPGGRYLVSNYGSGFVREVDADAKTIREVKIFDACGLDRLPNGQMLVSGQSYAIITDWTGKSFWNVKSGGCIRRIHRR